MDVVNERSLRRRGHVINDNVRLGNIAFEKLGGLVQTGYLPTVLSAASGPKEQETSLVPHPLKRVHRAVEQLAVGVNQCEVNVDENVCIFHGRRDLAERSM